jgi:hypothetical protein
VHRLRTLETEIPVDDRTNGPASVHSRNFLPPFLLYAEFARWQVGFINSMVA